MEHYEEPCLWVRDVGTETTGVPTATRLGAVEIRIFEE